MKRQSQRVRRWLALGLLIACGSIPLAQPPQREREAREQYQEALARAAEEAGGRPWLGVFLSDAVDGGVEVAALVPGGPAQSAGLREADLILEVEGRPAPNQRAMEQLIQGRKPGDSIELGLLRDGKSLVLRLELGERTGQYLPLEDRFPVPPVPSVSGVIPRPDRIQSRAPRAFYGLQLAEMTPALREHFGAPREVGVLVLGVAPGESATLRGFQVGDVVVQLDGRGIRDEDQLRWTLSSWPADHPLEARVIRGGEPLVITLEAARPLAPAAVPAPEPSPAQEREILEQRLRAEIERLEQRIRELREELEQLRRR